MRTEKYEVFDFEQEEIEEMVKDYLIKKGESFNRIIKIKAINNSYPSGTCIELYDSVQDKSYSDRFITKVLK